MCIVYSMYVTVAHLLSWHQTSSQLQLQHTKLFLDCCHQFCKATHDDTIKPFWLSKGNHVTLLNLPEQIERFGPSRDYWDGTRERSIQLIKQKLVNMLCMQTYMSGKLTEIHQSIVLDWIMQNLDLLVTAPTVPHKNVFYT